MKPSLHSVLLTLAVIGLIQTASAQRYQTGEIVEDFNLVDRSTGQPLNLYDLEGKIIFLEWFAYWCPFCQQAAGDIEPDIVEYYKQQGGTQEGIDFIHVGINLQANAENSTQAFIDRYNFGLVLNDFTRAIAGRFGSGQPIFAIINGVNNSPTHEQWELMYSLSGYGSNSQPIQTFRSNIDSVTALTELANISTRGRVGSGDNIMIGGFVVEGTENQMVLIQGVGLELAEVSETDGLTNETVLNNPSIRLFKRIPAGGFEEVAFNDDWESEGIQAKIDAMGLTGSFGLGAGSQSAALLVDLEPGAYTAFLDGGEGIALIEAYEVNPSTQANGAQLVNISTRGRVGTDDNILIGGFVVEGSEAKAVLVQGVGPELASVSDTDTLTPETTLTNPTITLFRRVESGFEEVESNDDWASNDKQAKIDAMLATGSFSLEDGGKVSCHSPKPDPRALHCSITGRREWRRNRSDRSLRSQSLDSQDTFFQKSPPCSAAWRLLPPLLLRIANCCTVGRPS